MADLLLVYAKMNKELYWACLESTMQECSLVNLRTTNLELSKQLEEELLARKAA